MRILTHIHRGSFRPFISVSRVLTISRIHPDPNTEDFVSRMMGFIRDNIIPLPEEPQHRGIRIAVLDTGIHIDEEDELLKGAEDRIVMKQSFLGSDPDAYVDSYGHGTHVVRLLLRFAPRANILVAKISESKQLTGIKPIVKVSRRRSNW